MGNSQPHGPGKIQGWAFSLPSFFQNTLETSKINHSSVQKNGHSKITSIRGRGYVILEFTGALWKAYALVKKNQQKKGAGDLPHLLFLPSTPSFMPLPKSVIKGIPRWLLVSSPHERWLKPDEPEPRNTVPLLGKTKALVIGFTLSEALKTAK